MTRRRSLLRSPGVLFIAFTLMLATAGFVYTHWTTTQTLEVQTSAGSLWVQWSNGATNDDGVENGDGEPTGPGEYDGWGLESSLDPSGPKWNPERYPKDVGGCWIEDLGGEFARVNVSNAYPSYHCSFSLDFAFRGSVPARVTASNMQAWVQTDAYCYDEGSGPVRWPGGIAWDDDLQIEIADFNDNGVADAGEPEVWYCDGYPTWPMNLEVSNGDIAMVDPHPEYGVPELTGAFSGPLGMCGVQLDPVGCYWEGEYDPDGDDLDGDGNNEPLGIYDWHGPVNCDDQTCWAEAAGYGPDGFMMGEEEPDNIFDGDDFEVFEVCGSSGAAGGFIHLENASVQGAQYSFHVSQEYVNYNEFSYCMCNDGADAYDEAGNWIGTVDHFGADCLAP